MTTYTIQCYSFFRGHGVVA